MCFPVSHNPDIPGIGPASIRSVAHCEPSLYSRHWCFQFWWRLTERHWWTRQKPNRSLVSFIMAGQPTSPQRTPPRNKALLRAYWPLVSLNKTFTKPCFWKGGTFGGGVSWPAISWSIRINLFQTGLVSARGWFAKVVYLTSRFETMIFFEARAFLSTSHVVYTDGN